MLKTLIHRLLRRRAEPAAAEEPLVSPLTVLAVDPAPAVELIDVDHLWLPWLLGAGEAVAQDLGEAESRTLRALKRVADEADPATAELVPRLPAIIPVLLRSLRDRNVSQSQLAAQVEQDAVLVAAILRQVNSAWFQRAAPVRTIEEALAMIGQNGLRMLVASVAFKPLFSAGLGPFTGAGAPRVWALSAPYGFACRRLAAHFGADAFETFLAGLLRKVGVIVALRLLDQAGTAHPGELRSLAFQASFGHYCRRLSRLVGSSWEFPPQAVAAAAGDAWQSNEEMLRALGAADRLAKLHVLLGAGALREELADACLEGEEEIRCWREMAALDRDKAAQATESRN